MSTLPCRAHLQTKMVQITTQIRLGTVGTVACEQHDGDYIVLRLFSSLLIHTPRIHGLGL